MWCDHQEVREGLGYATIPEISDRLLPFQSFEDGWLILIGDSIYAMIDSGDGANGTWESIPLFDYETISLKSQSELSSEEVNLGLGYGIKHLPDRALPDPFLSPDPLSPIPVSNVPFELGWKATTQCQHVPDRPALISLELDMSISNPVSVYLLLQAGYGLKKYKNQDIADVVLNFNDSSNSPYTTTLTLGSNIRDWADRPDVAETEVASSTVRLAWKGTAPDETPGRMDILTINIPEKYHNSIITGIQVLDISELTTKNINPCIHLLAVTVKHLRPSF